jgi:uncharacterized glyoxalase superfamily protein PhnB
MLELSYLRRSETTGPDLSKNGETAMKLVNARLVTNQVTALAEFYSHVLGIEPVGSDDYVELRLVTGSAIAISSKQSMDQFGAGAAQPAENRSVILDFQVDDVDRECCRLASFVRELVLEPTDQPWGSRSMLFRDPDGNLINFFAPRHRAPIQ